MKKTVFAFIIFVILPALALAFLGLRRGDDFERRELALLRSRIKPEFDGRTEQIRKTLLNRIKKAENLLTSWKQQISIGALSEGPPLFFITEKGKQTGRPLPQVVSDQENRLFRLCLMGGQKKEFVEKDFAAAADAYTFFLGALKQKEYRAEVIFSAARSLRKSGRNQCAEELFKEVADNYPGSVGSEGEPLDTFSLIALYEMGSVDKSVIISHLKHRRNLLDPGSLELLYKQLKENSPEMDVVLRDLFPALERLNKISAERFVFAGKLFCFAPVINTKTYVGTWLDLTLIDQFQTFHENKVIDSIANITPLEDDKNVVFFQLIKTEKGVPLGRVTAKSPPAGFLNLLQKLH